MKTGTLNHLKTKRLKRILGIPLYQVIGILETLWAVTAECTWDGGIGKYSDEEIAAALEWEGDTEKLIAGLVESGWLDKEGETALGQVCRLVVHDWSDHCPDFIRKRIARALTENKDLRQENSDNGGQIRTTADKSGQRRINPTQPNHVQPCPTNSSSPKLRFTDEDKAVAEEIWNGVQALNPNHKPPNLDAWANEVRLMRERDGPDRTHQAIRELFAWANHDRFWQANILSPAKLREKWDQLQVKRKGELNGGNTNAIGPGQRYNPAAVSRDPEHGRF